MINLIVLAVIVAIIAHVQWTRSRRRESPGLVARDIGWGLAFLYVVIEGSRFAVDWAWWRELGQLATFWQYLRVEWLPQLCGSIVATAALVLAFRLARRRSGAPAAATRLFGLVGYVVAIVVGFVASWALLDPWTIALFLGTRPAPGYRDPIFGHGLSFYLFRLPFYEMIFAWIAAVLILALVIHGAALALSVSGDRWREMQARLMAQAQGYAPPPMRTRRAPMPASWPGLLRLGGVLLLVLFAVAQFLARYSILYSSHDFLYGADYVDARWAIPLYWTQIVVALALAGIVAIAGGGSGQTRGAAASEGEIYVTASAIKVRGARPGGGWAPPPKIWAAAVIAVFVAMLILPSVIEGLVRQLYVHPNELALERPYIADHIHATWMAYNIAQSSHEEPFTPRLTPTLDLTDYPNTADNLRVWDWQPFHDNVTQLQALRPYYTFPDVDFERYPIGGSVRQVMISARALDTDLLPQQAQTWVNLNFQYTHGYGAVAALVNAATQEGQPELFLKDAPPVSSLPEFRITRPQIYFGEQTTHTVFVDSKQPEFDYPRGDDNAYNTYRGSAGIPMGSFAMRWAAAVTHNDWNILLTEYLDRGSRLLLHRQIVERVQKLAPFLWLDPDPYLVVDDQGRLFWMLDAYTYSDLHPYAEPITVGDREINYIRNSVKITVDAYNGTVHFYVFDDQDPVLAAYRRVFPHLFTPRAEMPAGLLRHIRYPETIFGVQAQIYRVYHMQDPQVFYNKEDKWDVAKQVVSQEESSITQPYYVMIQLPGEKQAEFVLMLPFTPNNRDNLIAWIAARCDPAHYGQIVFYRLPKDQLIYGPLQIESRVDQDRDISKDLSLWDQQGSRVIRGNTLVLPVDGTFLYVEPIYIQATQARLPELKKVVLALGDRLIYADDLDEAMAALGQPPAAPGATTVLANTAANSAAPASASSPPLADTVGSASSAAVLQSIEQHMERYRQLTAQGQLAAAGRELEAVDEELHRALGHSLGPLKPKS